MVMALPSSLDWVNEVSMMVGFAEPFGNLQSEHIGLFWHRVRGEYPKVEQTLPHPRSLNPSMLLSLMSRGLLPMPRFQFSSADGSSNLFVQQDHFLVSWRRRYPGEAFDFDGFFVDTFARACGLLEDFVREELNVPRISTDLCELNFSGQFRFQGSSPGIDLGRGLLGTLQAPDIGVPLSGNPEFGFTYYYDLKSGIHIQVDGELEYFGGDSDQGMFSLELEGSQRLDQTGKSELRSWMSCAHKSILSCYRNLNA